MSDGVLRTVVFFNCFSVDACATHRCHLFEYIFFVSRVAFYSINEIGDETVSFLQLYVDAAPRFLYHVPETDKFVVHPDNENQ